MKTAINAVAPIEPFKLFHNIDVSVSNFRESVGNQQTDMVNSVSGSRCKPAGLSQLGYACFWPRGAVGAEKSQRATSNNNLPVRHPHESSIDGNSHNDDFIENNVEP
jgi:hypothetical protein